MSEDFEPEPTICQEWDLNFVIATEVDEFGSEREMVTIRPVIFSYEEGLLPDTIYEESTGIIFTCNAETSAKIIAYFSDWGDDWKIYKDEIFNKGFGPEIEELVRSLPDANKIDLNLYEGSLSTIKDLPQLRQICGLS